MCGLSALRASGRSSVMVALCPSTSYLTVSNVLSDTGFPFIRSPALESRRPPLGERGKTFFEVERASRQFDVEEFLVHRLTKRRTLGRVNGLLGQADRHGGAVGEAGQKFVGGGIQFGLIHAAMDQTPVGGFRCGQLLTEKQHFFGPRQSGETRQQ